MKFLTTLALVTLIALSGCGTATPSHPEVTVDQTACSHCRMLVSDLRHASGVVTAEGEEHAYDDIACLLASGKAGEPGATAWFHAFDEETWTRAGDTTFVVQSRVRGPMGGNTLAYASAARASEAAGNLGGRVIESFSQLEPKGDQP